MRPCNVRVPAAIVLMAISFAAPIFAQNSGFNLNMHANSHATAKEIGLPVYPGAMPFKDNDSDSSSADLGLVLNSFHFSIRVASFVTADSAEQVIEFYRRPLAKYGEVLECDHGKPVGALTMTRSGLTCGDRESGRMTVNGKDSDHELRAGSPQQFRVVGIDSTVAGKTKFGLVALLLPKDEDGK